MAAHLSIRSACLGSIFIEKMVILSITVIVLMFITVVFIQRAVGSRNRLF